MSSLLSIITGMIASYFFMRYFNFLFQNSTVLENLFVNLVKNENNKVLSNKLRCYRILLSLGVILSTLLFNFMDNKIREYAYYGIFGTCLLLAIVTGIYLVKYRNHKEAKYEIYALRIITITFMTLLSYSMVIITKLLLDDEYLKTSAIGYVVDKSLIQNSFVFLCLICVLFLSALDRMYRMFYMKQYFNGRTFEIRRPGEDYSEFYLNINTDFEGDFVKILNEDGSISVFCNYDIKIVENSKINK